MSMPMPYFKNLTELPLFQYIAFGEEWQFRKMDDLTPCPPPVRREEKEKMRVPLLKNLPLPHTDSLGEGVRDRVH